MENIVGVKTAISLQEAQRLFPSYKITELIATSCGIMDSTYFCGEYILKRYERESDFLLDFEKKLLEGLKALNLNVPRHLASTQGWHLYERLEGEMPRHIKSFHIQALARFLAQMHSYTYKKRHPCALIDKSELSQLLFFAKSHFFFYYKKYSLLKEYKAKADGIIHADIFKDNTVFCQKKLGVFDFIDAKEGSFSFDIAVVLLSFTPQKEKTFFINLFCKTYNQHAPKKIEKSAIMKDIDIAKSFYALKRIKREHSTKNAKELLI